MNIDFSIISQRLADCYGDKTAIFNVERQRRYSFTEFHLLTNRVVNMMRGKLGLGRGDYWVNILENDNLSLLHYFTAFKSESAACYTNYRDDLAQHLQQIDLVGPKVVFVERELLDTHYQPLRDRNIEIVSMDTPAEPKPGLHDFWELMEDVDDANPHVVSDDRADAVILRFTGGTTGNSKCAMYSITNWTETRDSFYRLRGADWHEGDRMLHLAPMSHGSGMLMLPVLFKGGCNYTLNKPDLVGWCAAVQDYRINVAMMVPTILYRLLEMPEAKDHDLTSLESVYYGASPMSPAKLQLLRNEFGDVFIQIYASTEHPGLAVSMSREDHSPIDGELSHLAAAGRPVPGVDVLIADDEGNEVDQGEKGEIWIRSQATCLGYLKNPEATEQEFTNGYWRSGDIGQMDDRGFIHIVDRKKDMIISGGFNVYATEVENVLNAHPSVLISAVIGVPHEEWGEAVHAEVVLREGQTLECEELINHIRAGLGGYKTPKTINFVDELPMSAVGKVLRREVRSQYWAKSERSVG